jgi:hypothetical protein
MVATLFSLIADRALKIACSLFLSGPILFGSAIFELNEAGIAGGGATVQHPQLGKVFSLSGESLITLPAPPAFPAAFTLEAIVKLERPKKNEVWTLLGSQGNLLWTVNVYERGAAKLVLQTWADGKESILKTREWLEYGRWYYLAVAVDAGAKSASFYFNAVPLSGDKFQDFKPPEAAPSAASRPFAVGGRFRGEIALLAATEGAKSASDIRKVYESHVGVLGPQTGIFASITAPVEETPAILKPGQRLDLVPTFNSCSFYARATKDQPAVLRFRKPGASWQAAYPPVFFKADGMFRGSLVNLQEASDYEVEFSLEPDSGARETLSGRFRTWSAVVPIAKTIRVSDILRGGALEIREKGKPDGWIRYDGTGVILAPDDKNLQAAVLLEGAAYVILENFIVRGGALHAIEVRGCDQVRILAADLSGWGRVGTPVASLGGKYRDARGSTINNDAGVFVNQSSNTVIERCWAHDPAGHSNPWDASHPLGFAATHPSGPNAVFMRSLGGTVIRWNDFTGSEGHRWNDTIEGWNNGGPTGSFYRDADIHGNFLAFGQDDGIEMDGGQMNVRFFGNKVEGFLCGISIAPCVLGPSYIFGNLVVNLGDENGWQNTCLKPGGGSKYFKGRAFIFQNTFASPGKCIGGAGYGSEKDSVGYRVTTANNVLFSRDRKNVIYDPLKWEDNQFDHDLYFGGSIVARTVAEASGIEAVPAFVDLSGGDLRLTPGSVGTGKAVAIANFNDGVASPDLGAFLQPDALVPDRPIPLRADRYQLNFRGEMGKATPGPQAVAMSAPNAPKGWKRKFRVLKNFNLDWFTVSPDSGEFTPGKTVAFQVSFAPGENALPALRGSFLVKMDDGFSVPVTVYGDWADRRGEVSFAATAAAEINPPYRRVDDAGATDGKCVFIDTAEGQFSAASNRVSIAYAFDVASGGTWYLSARIKSESPTGEHDSCYFALDDGPIQRIDLSTSESWTWSPLKSFKVEPGRHRIRIYPRETGVYWDRFALARTWVKN